MMRLSTLAPLVAAMVSTFLVSAQLEITSSNDQCSNRKLSVRKEWRNLSKPERKGFIDALKCMSTKPHNTSLTPSGATSGIPPVNTSSSYWDDFVYAHMDSNVNDHFTAIFFPWHRWYLHTFHKALQDQCGYSGALPFWDWSKDVANVPASPVFDPSPIYGLGTLGSAATDYNVTDGALANVNHAYPTLHLVKRNFTITPFKQQIFPLPFLNSSRLANETFTPAEVDAVVGGSRGNFTDFAYKIDGVRAQGMHNAAHLMMGGDLSNPLVSPNDPLFWMHHAHLDCIWARWQNNHTRNAGAFGGGLTQNLPEYDRYPVGAPPQALKTSDLPTVGLSDPVKVQDVLDTKNNYLCYKCEY